MSHIGILEKQENLVLCVPNRTLLFHPCRFLLVYQGLIYYLKNSCFNRSNSSNAAALGVILVYSLAGTVEIFSLLGLSLFNSDHHMKSHQNFFATFLVSLTTR